jgi:membrane-bound metal-dependent hydrolase YbcI (DUF457 family)
MALFREHVTVGAIVSMVAVVLAHFYALVTDPLLLVFLFVASVVGSFLPDVDSDSGIPFQLVFGLATLAVTGVALLYMLTMTPDDWRYLIGVPAAVLLTFWFIVGGTVKKFTKHRGIYHSLPALLIACLGTYLAAERYGLDEVTALVFAAAVGAGFASHLLLDEIHAGITLDGIPFNPNKAFGSALKLFSHSNSVNIATYTLLAVLLYVAFK